MSSGHPSMHHLAIVVPAHDEAATVEACIRSIDGARSRLPATVTSSIVVVADSCTDATAELARRVSDPICDLVIESRVGAVGAARRIGTAAAMRRSPTDPDRTWICSTDADSTVPTDWLTTHLDAADLGYVAVAGVVRLDPGADPRLRRRFHLRYAVLPNGTHGHVHGTNLGFRADAYTAAGGWNDLPTGEDHDLWHRLDDVGKRLSSVRLSVTTSARTSGRAPAGFADVLANLSTEADDAA